MKKQVQLTDISGKAHYIPIQRHTPANLNAPANSTLFDSVTVLEYRVMSLYGRDYNGIYTSYSCKEISQQVKRPMSKIRRVIGKLEKRGWLEGNGRYPIFYHIPLKCEVHTLNIQTDKPQVSIGSGGML